MRIVRLPGIHHDSNVVLAIGNLGCIVIDTGTSWYQALQLERIQGILNDNDNAEVTVDRILLTSRRFPCSGGAKFLSSQFDDCPIHIHREGQSSLETGDFSPHGQTDLTRICHLPRQRWLRTVMSLP